MTEVRGLLATNIGPVANKAEIRRRLAVGRNAVKRLRRLGAMAGEGAMPALASELKRQVEETRQLKARLDATRKWRSRSKLLRAELEARAARQLAEGGQLLAHTPTSEKRALFEVLLASSLVFEPGAVSGTWRLVTRVPIPAAEQTCA